MFEALLLLEIFMLSFFTSAFDEHNAVR